MIAASAANSTPLDNFMARALFMATRGMDVMPVLPKSKDAFLKGWPELATRDVQQIREWGNQYPNHNTGVVARSDTLWLLDADDGTIVERYERETGNKFPDTFTVRSRPGRGHFYFRPTDASRSLGNIGQDQIKNKAFSVRAHNEYVVGPGSIHEDTGKPYEIVRDTVIVAVPDALIEWIKTQREPKTKTSTTTRPKVVSKGGRNSHLTSRAGSLQRSGISFEGLCEELRRINSQECVPPLANDEVLRVAKSVSRYQQVISVQPEEEEPEIVEEPLPEFPVIPGTIGNLADALCPDVPREFKIMALVTRVGLMMSGRVRLEGEPAWRTIR